jgi:replicative DNA helicase
MRGYDLKIDDRTSLLADIRTKARQVHLRQPLDLIVIDYLQLIDTTATGQRARNENRAEEVAKISKSLKKLARELKVPVLALAQMNRDSEKRGNALPQLSDLGDSSGIEKDSDCVMFIYCNDEQAQRRDDNLPYDLSIIVKKHRNGRMGSVPLRFRPKLTKFQDTEVTQYAEADD